MRWIPFALLLALPAHRSIVNRARASDRVVLADVLDSRVSGDGPRMVTTTRIRVREEYKGHGAIQFDLVQLGGRSGLWEAHLPGDPSFSPGETVVLFLRCREHCALVSPELGKVAVVPAASGRGLDARVEGERRSFESVVDEIRRAGRLTARPIDLTGARP